MQGRGTPFSKGVLLPCKRRVMDRFKLHAPYKATGDQPQAIDKLAAGVESGMRGADIAWRYGVGKDVYYG